MSDHEEQSGVAEETTKTPTMAETEETSLQKQQQNEPEQAQSQDQEPAITKKFANMNIKTVTIWPPTQRTREAVINRLIETLTAPSVLSKRYGSLSHEEASAAARSIEEEAFATATAAAASPETVSPSKFSLDDDGIEILQIYSKEISKRMLDTVKAKATAPADNAAQTPPVAATSAAPGTSEEISSVESETS